MPQATLQQMQAQIDNLTQRIDQLSDSNNNLVAFCDAANLQITALTDQQNMTVVEMDKQIQFQHWFFAEMQRPEDEPPVPFALEPILKVVK